MNIFDTALPGVKIIEPEAHGDECGFFLETFRDGWFREHIGQYAFVQESHTRSGHGVLRGLHYQTVCPQGRLVRAVSGGGFGAAVDLRRSSPTFGHWAGAVLSAENRYQMWIPPGFAHGFYVTDGHADLVCKYTDYCRPEHGHTLFWHDPAVGIDWPLAAPPLLSAEDAAGSLLAQAVLFD